VIDDLQVETQAGCDNPPDMTAPGICEGYLLKRRKWPLKGWHKVRSPLVIWHGSHIKSVSKELMCHLYFSDTLSWKWGTCVTPKINRM